MSSSRLGKIMFHSRFRLVNHLLELNRAEFWNSAEVLESDDSHQRISHSILAQQPFAAGRLGAVEASIVVWGRKMAIPGSFRLLRPRFSETSLGPTNAGIRPRTRLSYQQFADLAWDSLAAMDLLGVWGTALETIWLPHAPATALYGVESIAPTINHPRHLVRSLAGKRVLVVSPFQKTIKRQCTRLDEVWKARGWQLEFEVVGTDFPYLIDDECKETWQDVYDRIGSVVQQGDYDVALFGCGGLGLPLTKLAKQSGKVGLHLGGHLQLLFGIYGKRHLTQPWHASAINEAWTKPEPAEVATSAHRVEGGCYW